jgi:hypothetical protein
MAGSGYAKSIEQVGHDLLDARAQAFNDARGEGLADQAAEPRVVWRVGYQHLPGESVKERLDLLLHLRRAELQEVGQAFRPGYPSWIAQAGVDVGVARQKPAPAGLVEVDRGVAAHLVVERVGIDEHRGRERIVFLRHSRSPRD